MTDEMMIQAGNECVAELAAAISKAVFATMGRHGDDPNNGAIIAAALSMVIEATADVYPDVTRIVRSMIDKPGG